MGGLKVTMEIMGGWLVTPLSENSPY
jgi:hypothetical protein